MIGVGLRHVHFPFFEAGNKAQVDFFEIITENFTKTRGRPFELLMKLRRDYDFCMHGVSLSIAGTDALDLSYLSEVKQLMQELRPMFVSDHLCFTGNQNSNLHNLLPFAYTWVNLKRIAERVTAVQDFLGRSLLLENLSAYFSLKSSEMTEAQFLNELCKITGCGVLLDVNNLYVNSINQKFSAEDFLVQLNLDCVGQMHLAGYTDFGDYLFDTHAFPVHQAVWDLYGKVLKRKKGVPVLIEWDENIPPFQELEKEALYARGMTHG